MKKREIQESCKDKAIVKYYIINFIALPGKTMEFQHDEGEIINYSALDAIAYLRGNSLRLYQFSQESNTTLRHKFDHPEYQEEENIIHVLHEGGGNGSIGHFSRLKSINLQ